jgi:hypothetical protein
MDLVRAFLGGGILPFGEAEAVETSRLFSAAGRPAGCGSTP